MSPISRESLSQTIAQLLPSIIQGVHLGFLANKAITHTQFFVLIAIHSHQRCPMRALAENLHVSMPTISGIVDRLVKAGYIRRVGDLKDRRQVVVELTSKGKLLIEQFQQAVSFRWKEVLKTLDTKEVESFSRVILKLREQLQGRKDVSGAA